LLNGWFIELDKARGGKPGMGFEAAYLGLFETIRDLVNFPLLAYTPEAEARYRLLKPRSQRVEKRDVRIAAHALEVGMIVVTRNTDDFHRIPEVRYTDWSAGEPAVLQGVGRR
jgi:tRNA(fMet)-specific endonuclease VapC